MIYVFKRLLWLWYKPYCLGIRKGKVNIKIHVKAFFKRKIKSNFKM